MKEICKATVASQLLFNNGLRNHFFGKWAVVDGNGSIVEVTEAILKILNKYNLLNKTMSNFSSIEKTFLMIKPDGVRRGLVGEIFHRLERIGLKMVACRMIQATREQAKKNYPGTEDWLIRMGEKDLE